MVYLVEHFYSIQGEGKFVGTPSVFFRFGGCNLKCQAYGEYFEKGKIVYGCDTIRAVNKELFQNEWKKIENEKFLIEILDDYIENLDFKPHVVITGGEPMIYATDSTFYRFIQYLVDSDFIVTIETNTTIKVDFEKFSAYKDVVFAMAVKLSNSGEPYDKRVNKEVIKEYINNTSYSFFKFTLDRGIVERRAFEEIVDIVEPYPEVEIFCMPLGDKQDIIKKHDKAVAEFCLIYGFIYSDRLHVRLWNREKKR